MLLGKTAPCLSSLQPSLVPPVRPEQPFPAPLHAQVPFLAALLGGSVEQESAGFPLDQVFVFPPGLSERLPHLLLPCPCPDCFHSLRQAPPLPSFTLLFPLDDPATMFEWTAPILKKLFAYAETT